MYTYLLSCNNQDIQGCLKMEVLYPMLAGLLFFNFFVQPVWTISFFLSPSPVVQVNQTFAVGWIYAEGDTANNPFAVGIQGEDDFLLRLGVFNAKPGAGEVAHPILTAPGLYILVAYTSDALKYAKENFSDLLAMLILELYYSTATYNNPIIILVHNKSITTYDNSHNTIIILVHNKFITTYGNTIIILVHNKYIFKCAI
ncbi:hypothetical protein C8R42DRAFT_647849 [Lentinula raphanica]|nr:hypothetical protein C8R42DRAFT_647849 [Lentinula raphanica]